jgi:NitT/TauT family transport system permease protein
MMMQSVRGSANLDHMIDASEGPVDSRQHSARRPERFAWVNDRGWIPVIIFFGGLVLIWHGMAQSGWWSPVLLPGPIDVARYLLDATVDGTLPAATGVTLQRLGIGYGLGLIIGLPLGLLVARFEAFRLTIGRLALGLQTLPSVCWVPLSLIWFGQSETAMLFIVIMGSLWSVVLATEAGVRTVPPLFVRAARTMGSNRLHTWTHVIVPAAMPQLVGGLRQAWAFAWRSLMAAEIYVTVASQFGLGNLLHYGRELQAMDQVMGVMLVIAAIGLLADFALFQPWERMLRRRWGLSTP